MRGPDFYKKCIIVKSPIYDLKMFVAALPLFCMS